MSGVSKEHFNLSIDSNFRFESDAPELEREVENTIQIDLIGGYLNSI